MENETKCIKVRELTVEKMQQICDDWHNEHHTYSCDGCPFKLASIQLDFLSSEDLDYRRSSFSYCLLNFVGMLDKEIQC